MTATISSKGQILIPRPVRDRQKLRAGDDLLLLELSNGDILLRQVRKARKPLLWHLRQLQGLQLDRQFESTRKVA